MKSSVYFIEARSSSAPARIAALKKLLAQTGSFLFYKKGEIVPVKLTIGDSPCVYNINPELVKIIVAEVKKGGAKPFLFDTSVIYKGQRQNAVDHLNLAQSKGFGHSKVGAPFIIADGIFGKDGAEFILGAPDIKKIRIPSFVGMLDSLLVLSHATGHIVSSYACAIKNVAMGMACRATKQVQHSSLKPSVLISKCTSCGLCVGICPARAISIDSKKAYVDQGLCIGCGECLCACKFDAISVNWQEDVHVFCRRMAETARFVLSKFKNTFFINFALDVTKECDCISTKAEAIVSPDIGILASNDILSVDKATIDLIRKTGQAGYFEAKARTFEGMFEYAAKIGLGSLDYELIRI